MKKLTDRYLRSILLGLVFLFAVLLLFLTSSCSGAKKANASIYRDNGLIGKSNNRYAYHTTYYCGRATSVKKTYWYKPGTWDLFSKK